MIFFLLSIFDTSFSLLSVTIHYYITVHMSNVNCAEDFLCRANAKSKSVRKIEAHSELLRVHLWLYAYANDCTAAHIHERSWAMTRRRQGMPCSCLFHLMRQSQALIQSIYLALTLICHDAACQAAPGPMESVSQLQNVFLFLSLP